MSATLSDGLRIRYDVRGRGEPAVLCLPDWCDDRRGFARLVPLCAASRRTLALDWVAHGESDRPDHDFGLEDLVDNAQAVLAEARVREVLAVCSGGAGWVGIRLARELGRRLQGLVLLDWHLFEPPAGYREDLRRLRDPERWSGVRDAWLGSWTEGATDPGLLAQVRHGFGAADAPMWSRAARELEGCYEEHASPLAALLELAHPPRVLHLVTQGGGLAEDANQRQFSERHPWFRMQRLACRSHFPALEVPEQVADAIEAFLA